MITSQQIRASRSALKISADELAKRAGIASKTIRRIEAQEGLPESTLATIRKIKEALESAGIEFIGSHDDGPGIRVWLKS